MTARIVRFTLLGVAISLMLAAMTACFFGGGGGDEPAEEPTPTPNVKATIDAAIASSLPTNTPVPPTNTLAPPTTAPTNTPAPTPNLEATIAARMEAAEATRQAMATPTPEPTPVPPTATPAPPTPVPATATPAPSPTPTAPVPSGGPPAVITGKVTINGNTAQEGVVVVARSAGKPDIQVQTNEDGVYKIETLEFGVVYDLYVNAVDTGVDSAPTRRGIPQAINLSR